MVGKGTKWADRLVGELVGDSAEKLAVLTAAWMVEKLVGQ